MEQELFAFDANRLDVRGDAFTDDFRPTREDEALLIGALDLLAQRMDAFWYHLIDFFHAGIAAIGAFHGLPFPKVRILFDTIWKYILYSIKKISFLLAHGRYFP